MFTLSHLQLLKSSNSVHLKVLIIFRVNTVFTQFDCLLSLFKKSLSPYHFVPVTRKYT